MTLQQKAVPAAVFGSLAGKLQEGQQEEDGEPGSKRRKLD